MKARGFTLIEVVIALAIVGAMLTVMFGGLRVGVAAWRQGDARAERLQRERSLRQIVMRALAGAHPYRAGATGTDAARLVFQGEPGRIAFVTATPPIPFPVPIAFAAVAFSRDVSGLGLVVLQKPLPDRDPLERLVLAIADDTVTELRLRYLRPNGDWEERWDGGEEKTLPAAVEITLATGRGEQHAEAAPVVIALRAMTP